LRRRVAPTPGSERRLLAGVLVLFVLPTAMAGAALVVLARGGVPESHPAAFVLILVVGFVTLMLYLAVVAHAIGHSVSRGLRQIALGTELIATVNPDHRLAVTTDDELGALAEEINGLADRLAEARRELREDAARATRTPAGAGPVSRPSSPADTPGASAAPPAAAAARPDFYDRTLFEELERAITAAERGHRLEELTCVVLDAETTGLRPAAGDRVVSLAAVRVRGGQVRQAEVFDALVNPGRPIPAASTRFHGITDAHVAAAPSLDQVLPAFLAFAGEAVLVGHEVSFDLHFLDREATRLGLPRLSRAHPVLDTLALSRAVHPVWPDHHLDAVAARLGVAVRGRHSALGDALATAEVFVRLLALLRRRGVATLGQALDAARQARVTATA
jgi:DNA polymerase III epsilon subunit family exonuclease